MDLLMSIKLSICIPTYNRAPYLTSQLSKIYSQLEKFNLFDSVEVIVSNNASSDNTNQCIREFLTKGLIYHEQVENIGPDANFFTLFEMASGEYIWLLGDDDSFTEDIIEFIINTTQNNQLDYLYLRTVGDVSADETRSGVELCNTALFKSILLNTTFMSSQVIKASLIKSHMKDAKNHFGDLMAYYYLFLMCLSNSAKCMISHNREIYMEDDNTGGYKFYQVWGRGVLDVLIQTPFGKDKELLILFKNEIFLRFIIPITYGFRVNTLKSALGNDSALDFMAVHFGDGWRGFVFRIYNSSPIYLLKVSNFMLRVVNKYRRTVNGTVY
jgi:glycosyltransferase involved in cell wall biosynthesis